MKKILCIDDNQDYLAFLNEMLTIEGYQVVTADNAMTGIRLFKEQSFDLIISDLKMETVDGFKFLYLARKIDLGIRVILLTSSEDEEDEIRGLNLNVNSYIRKDISLNILLKKIEYVLKQQLKAPSVILQSSSEGIKIDTSIKKVYKNNKEVDLTIKEYEILTLFLKNQNIVLTREEIIAETMSEYQGENISRVVNNHVKKIRQKLHTSQILTVRGVGYEWVE